MLWLDSQSEIISVQGWQLVIDSSKLFLFLPILFLVSTALAVLKQNVNQPATQTKEQKIDRKTKKIGIGNLSETIENNFPRNFFLVFFVFRFLLTKLPSWLRFDAKSAEKRPGHFPGRKKINPARCFRSFFFQRKHLG